VTRRAILHWLLAAVGLGFLLIVLLAYRDEIAAGFVLSPWRFVISVAASLVGFGAIGVSWASMHQTEQRWFHVRRFLITQPTKYIPGGIAQPIGQVVAASQAGMSLQVTTARFIVHTGIMVCAGLLLGASLLASPGLWGIGLVSTSLGLTSGSVLIRMVDGLRFGRIVDRFVRVVTRGSVEINPADFRIPRKRLAQSLCLAVIGLGTLAVGFAVLAKPSLQPPTYELVGAFALAWTVGFVAIPFPAGVGVREFVLAWILPAAIGPLVAVALLQRVAQILAEALGAALGYTAEGLTSMRRKTGDAVRSDSTPPEPAGTSD
jgi:hypothetical protein